MESGVPAVRIEGLVKEFAGPAGGSPLRAVDGLSLRIESGAFYGLLGPNGAGKTTTIRILTGLARRSAGRVEVRGMDVTERFRDVRRLIGLAPQEFDFDQFLTARQVLSFRGRYFEMPRAKATRRADELLELFQLAHKRDVRVHHLSGGQKRRLVMAKSLMHDPEILILDEPTAGIDVSLRQQLWAYLRGLNRDGKTILLTTHYIEEAEALCGRVGIIDGGRLVAEGSPSELSEKSGSDLVVVRLAEACSDGAVAKIATSTGLHVEAAPGNVTLTARGGRGGAMATRLLESMVRHGLRVENLEIRRQSLQDAFITLTGRGIDAGGAQGGRGDNA